MTGGGFTGFPRGCVTFFEDLKRHNTKAWFDAHRDRYDRDVLGPSRSFVSEMGQRLLALSPDVNADPRVNKSLFRLNRDVRFSKDKSPYKTHMGIFFWEGAGKKMESPGYYVHLEPPDIMIGVGMYMFPRETLARYRELVDDARKGKALARAVEAVTKRRGITLGGQNYKRVPRGYDPDHPRADLLKHDGLHVGMQMTIPASTHKRSFLDFCMKRFETMDPVQRWLARYL